MPPLEEILIIAALLLLAGVVASKVSSRLGVPALLLFLAVGMLAGTEGFGGIPFDDRVLTQTVSIVALAFILFAGGLETDAEEVSGVVWRALSLSTLGVLVTAMVAGAAAAVIFGFSWPEGFLLGSIMSSTDAAAVFAVLRSKGVGLRPPNKPLLELESGSNDPMAVFLTMALIRVVNEPESGLLDLVLMFGLQMVVGSAVGYGLGRAAVAVVNRIQLETEGLYPAITLSVVILTYGLASLLRGNGFLAVYLAGIVIGNSDLIHKRSLVRFHDGLAWLMQIAMFVVLGLLVYPSHLVPVAGAGLLIAAVLTFAARPIGVFLSLALSKASLREKLLLSWVGLRGAVPIVLATFPFVAGVQNAETYFNVVFFVVLSSVVVQGTTIPLVARRLALEAPMSRQHRYPLEYIRQGKASAELAEVTVPAGSPYAGKQIIDLALPKSVLIVLLERGDDHIVPRGNTALEEGDVLLVLGASAEQAGVRRLLSERKRQGGDV